MAQECSSTCDLRISISIRVILMQNKTSEAQLLLTECTLPKTVEQFNDSRKEMFIVRVCFDDIQKIKAIQIQNITIAKV